MLKKAAKMILKTIRLHSDRRSGLVIQHPAGVDSRDRRDPVVLVANKRDGIAVGLAKAASCSHDARQPNGRYTHSIWC